jgi:hypothetical protein
MHLPCDTGMYICEGCPLSRLRCLSSSHMAAIPGLRPILAVKLKRSYGFDGYGSSALM